MEHNDKQKTKVTICYDCSDFQQQREAESFVSAPRKLENYRQAWKECYIFISEKLDTDKNPDMTDQEVAIYSEIQDKLIDLNSKCDISF
jgi:hypothetical protein